MRNSRWRWSIWPGILLLIAAWLPVRARQTGPVRIAGGQTQLDEIGLYDVSYRYRDGRSGAMPSGWTGHFEDRTGISCTVFGAQAGKSVFLLHPPWRNGTGVTDQTLRLALPKANRIALQFAIAMKEGEVGPGKSDGATFRVFVNDRKLLDRNKTDAAWSPFTLDLTPYAGRTVALRFETDPGPRDDPSFDYAFWGDRRLVVTGAPSGPFASSNLRASEYSLAQLVKQDAGSAPLVAPETPPPSLALHTRPGDVSLLGGASAMLRETAGRGRVVAGIPFGNDAFLDLVEPDGRVVRSDAPEVHVAVSEQPIPGQGGVRRTLRYKLNNRTVTVTVDLTVMSSSVVRADVSCDDNCVAVLHFGAFGPTPYRRQIPVPYYGSVDYLPDMGLFAHVFIDFTRSQASRLDGAIARYEPMTNGLRRVLRETAYYALSPDIHGVLPAPPNPPSPYRVQLADKIVLDVWGGRFADNADWLRELASYHLTHLLTIAHVWQNGGYDNRLPDVLPALESLGGDEGMKQWAQTAVGLKELFALHENYVDFYPNAPSYDIADVAHDSQNRPIPAWLNEGTGIQSFAVAPNAIEKYASRITPKVHARYNTNASYLDVHSAVPPWFHVDFRADQDGAARFQTVWNAHKQLWALFRTVHGGPVLGEGNNHWYWSGLLDGVEAQFGTGVPSNDGQNAPLFVDFDLTVMHPLQFNHGMGYLERWLPSDYEARYHSRIPTMLTLDQYRMQEVAYGHAGFVAAPLVASLPFVWQEHNLMWPLTSRYAAARVVSISYEANGRLLSANDAIAAGVSLDRVRIVYDNGLTLWANGRQGNWLPGKGCPPRPLPQYGWLAEGNGFQADTSLRSGPGGEPIVTDMTATPDRLFVNARSTVVSAPMPLSVRPSVAAFTQAGPRRFRIAYAWDVREPIPAGEQPFVHVTGEGAQQGEGIAFQTSSGIDAMPDSWTVGQVKRGQEVEVTLPTTLPDGNYQVRIGLYAPKTGERLALRGKDDGSHRIIVGALTVADGGNTLRFTPAQEGAADPYAQERVAHANPSRLPIDFGKVTTDGSLLLERQQAGVWLLTPFPRDRKFAVQIDVNRLDPSLRGGRVEALDADNRSLGRVPIVTDSRGRIRLQVNTVPGAIRYRLIGAGKS
jgi:hypothetical protein